MLDRIHDKGLAVKFARYVLSDLAQMIFAAVPWLGMKVLSFGKEEVDHIEDDEPFDEEVGHRFFVRASLTDAASISRPAAWAVDSIEEVREIEPVSDILDINVADRNPLFLRYR